MTTHDVLAGALNLTALDRQSLSTWAMTGTTQLDVDAATPATDPIQDVLHRLVWQRGG